MPILPYSRRFSTCQAVLWIGIVLTPIRLRIWMRLFHFDCDSDPDPENVRKSEKKFLLLFTAVPVYIVYFIVSVIVIIIFNILKFSCKTIV
jgi:hypothetical protein